MSRRKTFYLMSTAVVAGGLFAAPLPPAAAQTNTSPSAGDPPALVGRLAFTQGTVSFHTADQTQWQPATLNYPVSNGVAFWTEPQALAGIEVASSRIWMNGATELDVTTLNEQTMVAVEPQGELYLHLDHLANGQAYTIDTPRGVVTLTKNGRYDVVAGDTDHPTAITVVDGAAQISGNNLSLQVGPNQTATITGTDTFQGGVGAFAQDAFLASMQAREQPQLAGAQPQGSPPPVVTQMTGCQELQQYGSWQSSSQYGAVWYPQDQGSDWTPYQNGSWDYVAPWGWTWVSAEPWGFAPFHYGRWADIDGRWGWVPGDYSDGGGYAPPVYAPALVAFFGLGGGRDHIGWVPLAPGEPYYPPYHVGNRYLREVNRFNVRNYNSLRVDQHINEVTINNFANRRGAVVVPASVMTGSQPVRGAMQRLDPQHLAEAHPLVGEHPIRPTLATAGVTPRVAQELHLQGQPVPHGPAAPGPRIETTALARPVGPGEHRALPQLRQANVNPGAPVAGGAERHPGEIGPGGLPGLRAPNARPGEPGRPGGPAVAAGPHGPEATPREPGAPVTALPGLRQPGAGEHGPNVALPGGARPPEAEHAHIGAPPNAIRPENHPGQPGVPAQHEALVRPGAEPPGIHAPPSVAAPHVAPHPVAPAAMPRPMAPAPHVAAPPAAHFAPPAPHVPPHPAAPVAMPRPMAPAPHVAPPAHFAPPAPHFAPPAVHAAAPPRAPAPPHGGPPPRRDEHH